MAQGLGIDGVGVGSFTVASETLRADSKDAVDGTGIQAVIR